MKYNGLRMVAAALLTAVAAGCSDGSPRAAVRIAYLPITHAVVLQELTRQNEVPVELVKYGSWPELLDALNTGRVDAAAVLIEPAMKAKEQGVGLTALALGHRNGNVLVVGREIAAVADLRGKAFAVPHRSSSHYLLLRAALERADIPASEVRIVELPPPEMPSALASGRIAGYCVAEPFGAIAVRGGYGRILFQSDELWPDSICCALVANDAFLARRPEAAQKLLTAYHRAGERLGNKAAALTSARALLKQPDDVLTLSLEWISYSDLGLTRPAYEDLCGKMIRYGIAEHPPAYADFVRAGK